VTVFNSNESLLNDVSGGSERIKKTRRTTCTALKIEK
jgi:hypothetical protein